MKFAGSIGFWEEDVETSPGVYGASIKELPYYGDITRDTRRFTSSQNSFNEEFSVSNQISILADVYLQSNWSSIKYVVLNGQRIKVTSVEVNHPRIILYLGGVYNGEIAS